jgi:hypothetical protein
MAYYNKETFYNSSTFYDDKAISFEAKSGVNRLVLQKLQANSLFVADAIKEESNSQIFLIEELSKYYINNYF